MIIGAAGYTGGTAIDNAIHDQPLLQGWNAGDCAMWSVLGGVGGGVLGPGSSIASTFFTNTALAEAGYGISAGRRGEWTLEGAMLTGAIATGFTAAGMGAGAVAGKVWNGLRGATGRAGATGERALVPYNAPDRGALGKWGQRVLQVGEEIDRYGTESGHFASPRGTPLEMRSLPPSYSTSPPTAYRVVQPLSVDESVVMPWYGQFGMGTQYRLPESVGALVARGYLERIQP